MKNTKKTTKMKQVLLSMFLITAMLLNFTACGKKNDKKEKNKDGKVEVFAFVAANLGSVMKKIAADYMKENPDVKITLNADSSGTLYAQIVEGYECDIFFSAAQKQMDMLEDKKLVVEGTRKDVVNNQLVLLTYKGSGTKVTGLKDVGKAASFSVAGASVPAGQYTRTALMNLGMIPKVDDITTITTDQLSKYLGGIQVSEADNVSKALSAVVEGSCEIGTTYYSDIYGFEDKVEVLEKEGYDLTGEVCLPIARVKNDKASDKQTKAAEDFVKYILSDKAKTLFKEHNYIPLKK